MEVFLKCQDLSLWIMELQDIPKKPLQPWLKQTKTKRKKSEKIYILLSAFTQCHPCDSLTFVLSGI